MKTRNLIPLLTVALTAVSTIARAQWTTDFSKNTQIIPAGLSYDEKEIVTTDDGITYVFFIINSNGSLGMRLQIVDKNGYRLLERGGHTVSQEANKTWSAFNQHIELDKSGNAFIAVQDFRTNPDASINTYTIYKYAPDGKQLWEGIILNKGQGYATQLGLTMCGLDDGGCIFAYVYRDDTSGNDCIAAERLDRDGRQLWNKTVMTKHPEYGFYPYPFLVKGEGDSVIMMYLADGNTIKSVLIDENGNIAGEEKSIYRGGLASAKPWEVMNVSQGPDKGALITLMDADYNSELVYVKSDGTAAFNTETGGVILNDSPYGGARPAVTYSKSDDKFVCVYQQFDKNNTAEQGLYIKKISTDGSTVSSDNIEISGIQDDYMYSFYSIQDAGDGQIALFYQRFEQGTRAVSSFCNVYDTAGNPVGETIQFTGTPTFKQNLNSSAMIDGEYFLTNWDEERNGYTSLFMQKVETGESTGISLQHTTTMTVNQETFNASGIKTVMPQKGLNIVRTTYSNGNTETKKIITK